MVWRICADTCYDLRNGDEQVIGRYDTRSQRNTISRAQCVVQVAADGSATLVSIGRGPTGVRYAGGMWEWLQKDQRRRLNNFDQITLDINDPENTVFSCTEMRQDGMGGGGGGYYGGGQSGASSYGNGGGGGGSPPERRRHTVAPQRAAAASGCGLRGGAKRRAAGAASQPPPAAARGRR